MNIEKKLIETAINAALVAGDVIMEVYSTGKFGIGIKLDLSPLTIADKRAHITIKEILSGTGLPILSEEEKATAYKYRKDWDYYWLVDPLDGTKEFIKKNGEFTVNIALIHKGRPLLGVVYVPVTNMLYFGSEQTGTRRIDSKVLDKKQSGLEELLTKSVKLTGDRINRVFTIIASRSHLNIKTMRIINRLKKKYGEVEYLCKGSSLKFCMLAEGLADIYPRFYPTMEWDTAAGQSLVEFSGGLVFQANNGLPIEYNKEKLVNPYFIAFRDIKDI